MLNNTLYSFLLTTIAGFSTLIGSILIFFDKKKSEKVIVASLSFASAVMLTVSFTDLIPEAIDMLKNVYPKFPCYIILLLFINIGIIISFLIDKYLPEEKINDKGTLYKVGIISMLAIILHNIPEGMATFMASNKDKSLGIALTIAIALHNIPEGISISIPIFYATGSKLKAFSYTFISGLSELFGAFITYLFLQPYINDRVMGILFAIIAGIMMYISIYELLPTSLKYHKKKITLVFFIIGILFILINHFLFI